MAYEWVTGVGSAVGSAVGAITQGVQGRKNRAFQEKMLNKQMDFQSSEREAAQAWEEQMWNASNEYNSASSQMQRMTAAGINPNNAAQAISGGNAAASGFSPTQGSSPSFSTPQTFDIGSTISQMMSQLASVKLMESEASKNESEADLNAANVDLTKEKTNTEKFTQKQIQESTKEIVGRVEMIPQRKKELDSIIDKNIADKQYTVAEKEKVEQETKNLVEQAKVIEQQILSYKEQIKNLQKDREVMNSQMELNQANSNLAAANAGLAKAEAAYQGLINNYEEKLQGIGTSTKAASDKWINQRDQLLLKGKEGAEGYFDENGKPKTSSAKVMDNYHTDWPKMR